MEICEPLTSWWYSVFSLRSSIIPPERPVRPLNQHNLQEMEINKNEFLLNYNLKRICSFLEITEIIEMNLISKKINKIINGNSTTESEKSILMERIITLPFLNKNMKTSLNYIKNKLKIYHLCIQFSPELNDFDLLKFPSFLISLDLSGCKQISDVGLKKISKNCRYLRHLFLYWNINFTDEGASILFDILDEIKFRMKYISLSFSGCSNIGQKCIEALTVHQNFKFHSDFKYPTIFNPTSFHSIYDIEDGPFIPPPPHLPDSCAAAYYINNTYIDGLLELNLTKCFNVNEDSIQLICKKLPHLKKFILYGCNHLKPHAFKYLFRLKYLNILDLCGTSITDEELIPVTYTCTAIHTMDLSWCLAISDLSIPSIARYLRSIKWISLHGIQNITLHSFSKLVKSAKFIQCIDIQGCTALQPYMEDDARLLRAAWPHLKVVHLHN